MTITVAAMKPAQPSITSTNNFFTNASPSFAVDSLMRRSHCKSPALASSKRAHRSPAQLLHAATRVRANSASPRARQNSCYRSDTIVLVSTHTFLSRVATRTRLAPDDCGHLVELTIKTIAAHLDADTRSQLIDNLPPTLAVWAEAAAQSTPHGLRTLRQSGLAPEHVAVVCGGLAAMLPDELREALRIELPDKFAALLVPLEPEPDDLSSWRAKSP